MGGGRLVPVGPSGRPAPCRLPQRGTFDFPLSTEKASCHPNESVWDTAQIAVALSYSVEAA